MGEPKLFLVQACQGDQTDGVVKMSSNKSAGFSSYQLPNHADFLIATSTILGKSSLRNTLTGSYFMERFFEGREENFSREQAADEWNLNINLLHFLLYWNIHISLNLPA